MKDHQGHILYIGKANNLKNRIGYYFGSISNLPVKIQRMVRKIGDFEYIVTDSEPEALILECNLIKKFRPPYNARLKDGKSYPYIKIDLTEDFPQVYITRNIYQDGAKYFGPFATATSVRKTLDILKKLFPYRSCTKVITGTDPRPCLEYHINRCVAPCIGVVSREEYLKVIKEVVLFMEGETSQVLTDLTSTMEEASSKLEFERAAIIRDQIGNIQRVISEQQIKVDSYYNYDLDAVAMARGDDESWVEVFFIRSGRLIGRDNFIMLSTRGDESSHVLGQFIKQFYQTVPFIPSTIIVEEDIEDRTTIESWLTEKRGAKTQMVVPKRGERRKLVSMVANNASQGLSQMRARWFANEGLVKRALTDLQEALNLPTVPNRMECYDISNIQGHNSVGSMVVFENGTPTPREYKRFSIKHVDQIDDYAMMKEVLQRRFKYISRQPNKEHRTVSEPTSSEHTKSNPWGAVPDLVIIDGGKGHLSAALEVFLNLGIEYIPLASIAKKQEWIFTPHTPEPIVLSNDSQALHLVKRIRDEAHRFAIKYHRSLRSKQNLHSPLDMVSGIGPRRKKSLLKRFGSVNGIKEANIIEIMQIPGITKTLAIRLKEIL